MPSSWLQLPILPNNIQTTKIHIIQRKPSHIHAIPNLETWGQSAAVEYPNFIQPPLTLRTCYKYFPGCTQMTKQHSNALLPRIFS